MGKYNIPHSLKQSAVCCSPSSAGFFFLLTSSATSFHNDSQRNFRSEILEGTTHSLIITSCHMTTDTVPCLDSTGQSQQQHSTRQQAQGAAKQKLTWAGSEPALGPGQEERQAAETRGCAELCPSGTKCPCCSTPCVINTEDVNTTNEGCTHAQGSTPACFTSTVVRENQTNWKRKTKQLVNSCIKFSNTYVDFSSDEL